jgi:ABC-type transport system substrate-binding protein
MILFEWYMQPHALAPWFESLVYGSLTPYEGGYNIFPWRNEIADTLLETGMRSFDANQRQTNLWAWQEEFMRDPPWINLYYPVTFDILATWLTGYDPTASWFYDLANVHLNSTMLAEEKPLRDPNTLIYAVTEYMGSMSPFFIGSDTDEIICAATYNCLYKWSVDPFPTWPNVPDWEDYVIKPDMAADYPTYMTGPNGPDTRVRIPLREGMLWHYYNGTTYPLNATDVKWTFDTMLDTATEATGTADFFVIESVEIVNATCVDFILKFPYPDILSLLANDWGTACPLPWHLLKDIPVSQLEGHVTNKDFVTPDNWMPVSGPFIWDTIEPDVAVTLKKNPDYYGYGLGWGPYNVDTLIFEWEKNPASRLAKYINGDIDFGEYSPAPVQTYKVLNDTETYPNLRVFQYLYPASNPIWLNFNNEYLSNRYVRMAIANAIDYDYIINNILNQWGIETAIRGKTPILPQHYYNDGATTVRLFNTALQPYQYDPVLAQAYLDLWKYSQVGEDYTLSPIGDADFSGFVDMTDFFIWREYFGAPFPPGPPPPLPGQDKDADFDNTGFIEMADFFRWRENWGNTYP